MWSSPWLFKFSFVIFFLSASSTKARSNACFEDRRAITWQLEAFIARSVDWNGWLAKMASIVEAGTHCEWHSAGLRCDATVYFPRPGRREKWSGETNSCVALFVAWFSLPSRTSGSWQYPNWRRAVAPKLGVLLDRFLVHQFLRFLGRFSIFILPLPISVHRFEDDMEDTQSSAMSECEWRLFWWIFFTSFG